MWICIYDGLNYATRDHEQSTSLLHKIEKHVQKKAEASAEAVVKAQLAYHKAEQCKRILVKRDTDGRHKMLMDRATSHEDSAALVEARSLINLVPNLTGFGDLALLRQGDQDVHELSHDSSLLTAQNLMHQPECRELASDVVWQLQLDWTTYEDVYDDEPPGNETLDPLDNVSARRTTSDTRWQRSSEGDADQIEMNPNRGHPQGSTSQTATVDNF